MEWSRKCICFFFFLSWSVNRCCCHFCWISMKIEDENREYRVNHEVIKNRISNYQIQECCCSERSLLAPTDISSQSTHVCTMHNVHFNCISSFMPIISISHNNIIKTGLWNIEPQNDSFTDNFLLRLRNAERSWTVCLCILTNGAIVILPFFVFVLSFFFVVGKQQTIRKKWVFVEKLSYHEYNESGIIKFNYNK